MFLLPRSAYQIRQTKTKGRGVFAREVIEAGTLIGDYLGRLVTDDEATRLEKKLGYECYTFEFTEELSLFPVDVKAEGVHLINHSCAGNCNVTDIGGHNVFFALRKIFPGEELTFDYEFDPDTDDPISPCYCDSPFCRGTMYARVEKPHLKRVKAKKVKKTGKTEPQEKYKAGQIIGPLAKYPKTVKDNPEKYQIFANLKEKPVVCKDKKLPSLSELRKRLRKEGRALSFKALGLKVMAVVDDYFLSTR